LGGEKGEGEGKKKARSPMQNGKDYENNQLVLDSQNAAVVSATLSELYFVPFLML